MNSRSIAFVVAATVALAGLALVVERGGLIAWLALILGVAWFGTLNYVISTWESGEVVELTIDTSEGPQVARLWVLDIDEHPTLYYDAPPLAAQSLLAQTPVQFSRAGEVSTRVPQATEVDALPEAQANRMLEGMQSKYGERNSAAMVYYGLLGRARDRVPLVVKLL